MEIIKQLYDVASLFDIVDNLSITENTFRKFATIELRYRHLQDDSIQQVCDDIYQTALSICLRGLHNPDEYKLLIGGINRISNFIHSERYTLDSAIINASKAAYLSKLISRGITGIRHFSPNNQNELASKSLQEPLPTKLNKLKKTHMEAFFYWCEIQNVW